MPISGGRRRAPPTTLTMLIVSRNCRGFGSSKKVWALRRLCRQFSPDLLLLSETKIPSSSLSPILSALGYTNNQLIDPLRSAGGLCLAWKLGVDIEVEPTTDNVSKVNNIQLELDEELKREESIWLDRSRLQRIFEGDINTKFFHLTIIVRRRRNAIEFFKTSDEVWVSSRKPIGDCFNDHFHNIFTSTDPSFPPDLDNLISPVVTAEDNHMLCAIPDEAEIKETINRMGEHKAPGPDGMTVLFYKTYWNITKLTIINSVQSFFAYGFLLKEQNHTLLTLIPKSANPTSVNHYRTISLCNVTYKIISAILANRLKAILHKLISPLQAAFIPNRLISDNSILVQEI
ncbi:hypothetical protein RJ639_010307 [Escallonia herrerae]|uniref:Reverse transcriptase domain-containing protein n=1 Tax=Escallonia herrerae TaxID=1293975 RepID=A0AA88VTA6_9ASTE|nr:hypothetical protein RJ639_010307 [Escallonia herrerae]